MLILQKGAAGYWKYSYNGTDYQRCQRGHYGYRWEGDEIVETSRLVIFDKHYNTGAPIAENLGDIHLEEISPAVPGVAEIEAWLEANFFLM